MPPALFALVTALLIFQMGPPAFYPGPALVPDPPTYVSGVAEMIA
jgi:hypothetical protein